MIETRRDLFACRVLFASHRAIVTVSGDIDIGTAPFVERKMNEALTLPISGVRVDLGDADLLRTVPDCTLCCEHSPQPTRVGRHRVRAGRRYRKRAMRVLELTGMTERFRFRDSALTQAAGHAPWPKDLVSRGTSRRPRAGQGTSTQTSSSGQSS